MATRKRTFVIVGASLAGAKAAQTLRENGFDGRVVLLGAERDRPYERPPLSKEFLRGEAPREKVYVHPAGFYGAHEIELRLGATATVLDLHRNETALDTGERLAFDRLLLTTGVEPRRLSVPGSALLGVHYLRTLADSEALRERLHAGGKLVVIGAGWIGSEVAASARQRGMAVTMIAPDAVPLQRALGMEVGAMYRDLHADHGVELLLGSRVASFDGARSVAGVSLHDGRRIACDTVVVGIGAEPRTELAAAAGLAIDDGILVDAHLQTSAPHVFAAGDVANHLHPRAGRLRVEHWANAVHQGAAAARGMLGSTGGYERLPYFFSDQYDVAMEYVGHAKSWDRVVFRGDVANHAFIAFWLADGRVQAGMSVNVPNVTDAIEALIRSGQPIDVRRLSDPDVAFTELLSARDPGSSSET
jgi:3-phenylpropionate/trans-cinnamate dioxygenase ferredoxin reductase subunit